MLPLYGDGIRDDTLAIQQRIDSGVHELVLPDPKVCYLISRPLELPSDFRLVLPRFAKIRLAGGANCVMVKNRTRDACAHRVSSSPLWSYVNRWDPEHICRNIVLEGGVWDCSNREQKENPIWTRDFGDGYTGFGMLFYGVENLKIRDLTVKDPVNFAVTLDRVSWFTVEDIDFDFNQGNPLPVNMDGIHLNGNCHHGIIRNIKGTCYDDMVALNADEGSDGPIHDIEVAGLWGTDSHSAVRLLTVKHPVENIHIHDVYGSFYQYSVGITKYYQGESAGYYAGISLDHLYVSKAKRPELEIYRQGAGSYVFPVVWIQEELLVKDLSMRHLRRKEERLSVETFYVGKDTRVEHLELCDIRTERRVEGEMPLLRNCGVIGELCTQGLYTCGDPLLVEEGVIDRNVER